MLMSVPHSTIKHPFETPGSCTREAVCSDLCWFSHEGRSEREREIEGAREKGGGRGERRERERESEKEREKQKERASEREREAPQVSSRSTCGGPCAVPPSTAPCVFKGLM